eukprot:scaffold5475_cov164-Skeletonema_dohrnii-CCMP3373.AAC.3
MMSAKTSQQRVICFDEDVHHLVDNYEEINKVGEFAPSASANTMALPTSTTGPSSMAAGKTTLTDDKRKFMLRHPLPMETLRQRWSYMTDKTFICTLCCLIGPRGPSRLSAAVSEKRCLQAPQ